MKRRNNEDMFMLFSREFLKEFLKSRICSTEVKTFGLANFILHLVKANNIPLNTSFKVLKLMAYHGVKVVGMFTSLLIAYINQDDVFLTQGIVIFMNSLNIKKAFNYE